MELVVRNGMPVEGKATRGRPVLYDEKEWFRRTERFIVENYRPLRYFVLAICILIFIIVVTGFLIFEVLHGLFDWRVSLEAIAKVAVGMAIPNVLYLIVFRIIIFFFRLHFKQGLPVPGLYERGFEVPGDNPFTSVFLPFEELGEVISVDNPNTEGLDLKVFSKSRKWSVKVPISFLGPEGVAILLKRSRGAVEAESPGLVLYGCRNGSHS